MAEETIMQENVETAEEQNGFGILPTLGIVGTIAIGLAGAFMAARHIMGKNAIEDKTERADSVAIPFKADSDEETEEDKTEE